MKYEILLVCLSNQNRRQIVVVVVVVVVVKNTSCVRFAFKSVFLNCLFLCSQITKFSLRIL